MVDIGYVEAFMDWRLVYRDTPSLEPLADRVLAPEIAGKRTFMDRSG